MPKMKEVKENLLNNAKSSIQLGIEDFDLAENDKNRTPHNAILLEEVYRPTSNGAYKPVYKHQYYYSPIP